MERNIRLYPYFNLLFNSFFWGPIYFLFLNERVSLEQTLQLHALYYFFVVLVEVPSGYFSDQFGRKKTLLIASLCFVIANAIFFFSSEFSWLALAQFFMAFGYASYSGTNHAFHYDSLKALNRQTEFSVRAARVNTWELSFTATATLIGGASALLSLRIPYALTAVASLAAFLIALGFTEPNNPAATRTSFLLQLKHCLNYLTNPKTLWTFAFMILMTVVEHLPPEFLQPYTQLLNLHGNTPLILGILSATASYIAAYFAAKSPWLVGRIGSSKVFLLSLSIETVIMTIRGLWLHPIAFVFVIFRNVPYGLAITPYTTEINAQVASVHRATFFSLNSLAGRLSYSIVLFSLSRFFKDTIHPEWTSLSQALLLLAALSTIGILVLWSKRSVFKSA